MFKMLNGNTTWCRRDNFFFTVDHTTLCHVPLICFANTNPSFIERAGGQIHVFQICGLNELPSRKGPIKKTFVKKSPF